MPAEDEAARRSTVGRLLADELGTQRRLALAQGRAVMDAVVEDRVARAVVDALFGTGSLERLLADTTIENICVNGCDVVWVRDDTGSWRRESPVVASDAELVELVRTLAARRIVSDTRPVTAITANSREPSGSCRFRRGMPRSKRRSRH
ncbi:hypothetical protein [Streptomyces sp. NPDC058572]|uniref:hypothetical protein n=1 Tax=Streptomyces sp. NPDC058572 TaxID=3346546 RepID=UPI003651EE82